VSPQPDQRSPIALASEWVARITLVGMEMVLLGLGGSWLDKKLRTEPLFTLTGFAVGIGVGIFHLLVMTAQSRKTAKNAGNSSRGENTARPSDPSDPSEKEIDE
jgi:F0F1-type ATP synthase assembly protein I